MTRPQRCMRDARARQAAVLRTGKIDRVAVLNAFRIIPGLSQSDFLRNVAALLEAIAEQSMTRATEYLMLSAPEMLTSKV